MSTYCPAADSLPIAGNYQTAERPSGNAESATTSAVTAPSLRAVLRTSSYARAWIPPHLLESLASLPDA